MAESRPGTWWSRLWRPRADAPNSSTTTLRNPATWFANWLGLSTPSVNVSDGWRVGAVMNCVGLRSRVIASLPCFTYQRQPDGSRERTPWFTVYRILAKNPNPWMTPFGFFQAMVANLDVYGNAYAEIEWSVPGDPTSMAAGLWPIPAKMVSVERDGNGDPQYVVSADRTVVLPMASVVHFRKFAFDGLRGVSPIEAANRNVGLAYSTEEYGANWYNNGGIPSGVITHPDSISEEAATHLRESWSGMHGTLSKSARVAILEEGMQYHPITISPQEAQFLEVRKYSAGQIAALYGVPARLIGAHDGPVGWGSVEQETTEWAQFGLTPDLVMMEQELNTKLLKGSELYYAEFNLDALLRGDMESRMNANAVAWQHGALTINEWRARENMGPIKETASYDADGKPRPAIGDRRFLPLNFMPVERVDELIDARIAAGSPDNAPSSNPVSPRR